MGSKSKPKETQTVWNTNMTTVQQPTPTEQALSNEALAPINWLNSSGRDISTLKQMMPFLDIGNKALAAGRERRMGTGALQLGQPGSEQYQSMLRELAGSERAQRVYSANENAYSNLYGNAMGMLGNASQLANQRNLGALSSSTNLYATQLGKPSIWNSIISGAAQVGAGAASAGAFASDFRLKFSVKNSPYGLEEVLQLRPVWYIMDGQEQVGFIAQEVEKIMPEFVVDIRDGLKGVMYPHITAVLAKAVQELHAELKSVKRQKKGGARKMLSSCLSRIRSIF